MLIERSLGLSGESNEHLRIVERAGVIFIASTPSNDGVATSVLFSVLGSERVFCFARYSDDNEAAISLGKLVADTVRAKAAKARRQGEPQQR